MALVVAAIGQPGETGTAGANEQWRELEEQYLGTPRQLTFPGEYVKAGEAYFDPSGEWVVFQAIKRPTDTSVEADPFYAMFVAKLQRALAGGDQPIDGKAKGTPTRTHFALGDVERISPEQSANTCGWFHPNLSGVIVMGSTIGKPGDEQKSGFQVGSRRYVWMFPEEMEVVTVRARAMTRASIERVLRQGAEKHDTLKGLDQASLPGLIEKTTNASINHNPLKPLFSRAKYDAECSYDASGRFVLHTHIEENSPEGKPDGNIYVFDTKTQQQHALVVASGYDGGPFFSPDGRSICYRSDRVGNDLLQLFVADLRFEKDAEGIEVPVGIEREWQITKNEHVNWAPYWHPSGQYLVYASSEVGHTNYEVFAIKIDRQALRAMPKPEAVAGVAPTEDASGLCGTRRITHAQGADVLPAFSSDGQWLMWTSQRGEKIEGETRSSSQLWIAQWKGLE